MIHTPGARKRLRGKLLTPYNKTLVKETVKGLPRAALKVLRSTRTSMYPFGLLKGLRRKKIKPTKIKKK